MLLRFLIGYVSKSPRAVALPCYCTSESPGSFDKKIAGPHSQSFRFRRTGVGPANLHFNLFPKDAGSADLVNHT